MLTNLSINNVVLIEKAQISLGSGLTIFTGETGAGKSILMDSLSLALGARSESGLLRKGCDEALVEASFEVVSAHPSLLQLQEYDIPLENNEVFLRRSLSIDGKSKAFINGMRVNLAQLRAVGDLLADIHGQHDQQTLLNATNHVQLLDKNSPQLLQISTKVAANFLEWHKKNLELIELRAKNANRLREEELLKSWLEELEQLAPAEGEEIELANERLQLMASEQLIEAAQITDNALTEQVVTGLAVAERALSDVAAKVGGTAAAIAERLSSLYAEADDLAREVSNFASNCEPNPERLAEVDERLATMRSIARKHNVEVEELPAQLAKFRDELAAFEHIQENMAELENAERAAWKTFATAAAELTKLRQTAAQKLSTQVEQQLADLHMAGAKFVVQLTPLAENEWNKHGAEKVEFLVAANAGQSPAALAKAASGGEVSRLMLALKSVFYAELEPRTLVLDEIDTGIGGAVAESAGKAMRALSLKHQVFAITHAPQVAAQGNHHLKISKSVKNGHTITEVNQLTTAERTEELARMLSGAEVTDAAKAAAQSLLKGAA